MLKNLGPDMTVEGYVNCCKDGAKPYVLTPKIGHVTKKPKVFKHFNSEIQ